MSDYWFLESKALKRYNSFTVSDKMVSVEMAGYLKELSSHCPDDLVIVDGIASIPVRGILGNRPSFFDFMFDRHSGSYQNIIQLLSLADSNSEVKQIELRVDSPGGRFDGLFELMDMIKGISKPISALIENRADSAAYGIVSQADKIIALSEVSEVGSIGVAASFFVDENLIKISSTEAPKKVPDVATPEGVNVVKAELDQIHAKFAQIIADGRSAATGKQITIDTVNTNYGRGSTMLAEEGLLAGMLDEIIPPPARVSNSSFFVTSGNRSSLSVKQNIKISKNMDKNELKTAHPELFKEVFESGVAEEKDRVTALLKTGEACKNLTYAIKCVADGSSITKDTVQAEFMVSRMNQSDLQKRDGDNIPDLTKESGDDKIDAEALSKALIAKREARRKA